MFHDLMGAPRGFRVQKKGNEFDYTVLGEKDDKEFSKIVEAMKIKSEIIVRGDIYEQCI
jgi:hypothetical protein